MTRLALMAALAATTLLTPLHPSLAQEIRPEVEMPRGETREGLETPSGERPVWVPRVEQPWQRPQQQPAPQPVRTAPDVNVPVQPPEPMGSVYGRQRNPNPNPGETWRPGREPGDRETRMREWRENREAQDRFEREAREAREAQRRAIREQQDVQEAQRRAEREARAAQERQAREQAWRDGRRDWSDDRRWAHERPIWSGNSWVPGATGLYFHGIPWGSSAWQSRWWNDSRWTDGRWRDRSWPGYYGSGWSNRWGRGPAVGVWEILPFTDAVSLDRRDLELLQDWSLTFFDRNRNGRLGRTETLEAARTLVRIGDRDNSGRIGRKDWRRLRERLIDDLRYGPRGGSSWSNSSWNGRDWNERDWRDPDRW
jgi:hypothetical protein